MSSSGSLASLRVTSQSCYSTAFSHRVSIRPGEAPRPGGLENHFKHPAEPALCTKVTLSQEDPSNSAVPWAPREGGGVKSAVLPGLASWLSEPSRKRWVLCPVVMTLSSQVLGSRPGFTRASDGSCLQGLGEGVGLHHGFSYFLEETGHLLSSLTHRSCCTSRMQKASWNLLVRFKI